MRMDDGVDLGHVLKHIKQGRGIGGRLAAAFDDLSLLIDHDDVAGNHFFIIHTGRGDEKKAVRHTHADVAAGQGDELVFLHL